MKEIINDKEGMIIQVEEEAETEMHFEAPRGMLSGITGFKVGQFNIGKPTAGLVVAALNDVLAGLIQGVAGRQLSVAGRFAGAIPGIVGLFLLNTRMAKGWLGSDAVDAGNIVLIADLVTDYVFDIRKRIGGMVGGVKLQQTKAIGGGSDNQSVDAYLKAQGLA